MKTRPIRPARVDFDADGVPHAPDFGDVYHARAGALAQARHVFLQGNGLPERWRGRRRFGVLETGFGLGHNFLALWDAWRGDAARCERLTLLSIEQHPPTADDLQRVHASSALPELAGALLERWPPSTPNLHRLAFDGGRVELLLFLGDVADALAEVVGRFDAFLLDGFAPARNPAMWDAALFRRIGRLAAPGATAATWSVAREVRDGLAAAGFSVERAPGFAAKREMTVARFEPHHRPHEPIGRSTAPGDARDAVVLGAGIAGCATAAALAAEGVAVQLIDGGAGPAGAGSNQPGGIFHGTLHRADGVHARFTRAAALIAGPALHEAIEQGIVPGCSSGLLRLAGEDQALGAMQALADAQALPPSFVQALTSHEASELAGIEASGASWFYPGGGWIEPAALCRRWAANDGIETAWQRPVGLVQRVGRRWRAVDRDGRAVAEADVLVIATGVGSPALLTGHDLAHLPAEAVRGETTTVAAPTAGLIAPRLPVADAGYALALPDGRVLCGASSTAGDPDPQPRAADRLANLERLRRLTGGSVDPATATTTARVGFRALAPDRLPLLGPAPALRPAPATRRPDQPRFVEREPGLYLCNAFGSRGLTWAALAARLIAAHVAGAPWPLEADLADAVDPARFVARRHRTG